MTLIGQSASIVSTIIYGVLIIIGIAVLVIVGFAIYKFVMWVLYAAASDDKKKKKKSPTSDEAIMRAAIEDEIKYGEKLKKRYNSKLIFKKQKGGKK